MAGWELVVEIMRERRERKLLELDDQEMLGDGGAAREGVPLEIWRALQ